MVRNMSRSRAYPASADNSRSVRQRHAGLPTLPVTHKIQDKLVAKGVKSIKKNSNSITFQVVGYMEETVDGKRKGKPGSGKTRVAGRIAREYMALKSAELGGPVLGVFVASNAALAKEHVADIGAIATMAPFQKHMTGQLATDLRANSQAMISTTRAMMYKWFPQNDESFTALKELVANTGVKGICLLYTSPSPRD